MIRERVLSLLLVIIVVVMFGCVSYDSRESTQLPVFHNYNGPELDGKEIAIVHNDGNATLEIKNNKYKPEAVALIPGKQTILVHYYSSFGNSYVYLKEPFKIEAVLEAGHEYQLLSYPQTVIINGQAGSFFAQIADVTTDEEILKSLEIAGSDSRERLIKLLRSQSHIINLALKHPSNSIRAYAVNRLDSVEILRQVYDNDMFRLS